MDILLMVSLAIVFIISCVLLVLRFLQTGLDDTDDKVINDLGIKRKGD